MSVLVRDISKRRAIARGGSTSLSIERWLAQLTAAVSVSIMDYGAVGDGVTDDAPAITAAYNALPATGGIIYFPPGKTYAIGSMITIGDGTTSVPSTKQNVMLMADTVLNGQLGTNVYATRLKFTGANGTAAILRLLGPITCAVVGLTFDCNFLANGGIYATHAYRSRFDNLLVVNWKGSAYKIDAHLTHPLCYTGANQNEWIKCSTESPGSTSTSALEIGVSASAPTDLDVARNNFYHCTFITANNANANGILLRFCDIITFESCFVLTSAAATACNAKLIKLVAPTGNTTFPQNIRFINTPIVGDAVTNYDIDAGWTNSVNDGGMYFLPFMKGDVELCTNVYPTHSRLYGFTEEGVFFGNGNFVYRSVDHNTAPVTLRNVHDDSTVLGLVLEGDRATPAASDALYMDWKLSDSAGNQTVFARVLCFADTVTDGAETASMRWSLASAGTLDGRLELTPTSLRGYTTDTVSLGTSARRFTALYLQSGGAITFGAGSAVISHGANALQFTAAPSGYSFDAKIWPAANDGAALGDATHNFSDLFLASGAVLNWNNGDVTITHGSNALTGNGGQLQWAYDASGSTPPVRCINTFDSNANLAATFESQRATQAANDQVYCDWRLKNSAGVQTGFARITVTGTTITSGSEAADMRFGVMNGSGSLNNYMVLTSTLLRPNSNDLIALGNGTNAFADLFLASGGVINFNNGNVTVTHSAGVLASTGMLVSASGTAPPASGSTACGIEASSTSHLGIYFGTGAPTFSAAKGSLYSNTTATTTTTRLYVNTDGGTTWATFTASA